MTVFLLEMTDYGEAYAHTSVDSAKLHAAFVFGCSPSLLKWETTADGKGIETMDHDGFRALIREAEVETWTPEVFEDRIRNQ